MNPFPLHTPSDAPDDSKAILERTEKALGFVPNLYGTFAAAPALLDAYTEISAAFDRTSLDATERQIVLLTASRANDCDYCIAAHSTISKMQGISDEVIRALHDGTELPTPRQEALRTFTRTVVEKRGWAPDEAVRSFLDAGFEPQQVLEVILGIGMKTLSNYTNHVASPPIDEAFAANAPKASSAS